MNHTPNTPANGGQILTDERILELASDAGIYRRTQLGCYFDPCKLNPFARAIEADLRALAAVPASEPQQEREAALADRDEVPYLIVFDDHDRQNELVYGGTRARYRFKEISASWNANLFVKIASNSRDDKTPCYAAAPAPVSGMPDLARAMRKELNALDRELASTGYAEFGIMRTRVGRLIESLRLLVPDTPNPTGETK